MPEQIVEPTAPLRRFYPTARFPDEIDAVDMPETYVSIARGDCLEPAFHDGDYLTFSKSATLMKGDYVGVWFVPDVVPEGETPRQIKRLSLDPLAGLKLPWRATSKSELEPYVHLEMFNPPRKLKVPASRLLAMHKVIGIAESNGDGTATPTSTHTRLPPLPWFDTIQPGMFSYRIQDSRSEPLLSVGDCVVIDAASQTPEHEGLFLVQWSSGNRQVMHLHARELSNSEGKFTGWMIAPFRRPRTHNAAEAWTKHSHFIDWCSDGPYTDDGIATLLVGRVVGRCSPNVDGQASPSASATSGGS